MSINLHEESIKLSWQPPKEVHGILVGYKVSYQPLSEVDSNTGDSEKRSEVIISIVCYLFIYLFIFKIKFAFMNEGHVIPDNSLKMKRSFPGPRMHTIPILQMFL